MVWLMVSSFGWLVLVLVVDGSVGLVLCDF